MPIENWQLTFLMGLAAFSEINEEFDSSSLGDYKREILLPFPPIILSGKL